MLVSALEEALQQAVALAPDERLARRYRKLRALGRWDTLAP
jgi:acetyl-CoA carboxylase alpha subunit